MSQTLAQRIHGMLHGVAYGDAMGAPVEKLSAAEISARYGRVESLNTPWHKSALPPEARNHRTRGNGIITDDTLMTLALMEIVTAHPRHLDAWDMAADFTRAIAWTPRWVPELQKEVPLIERLFYPEKWIFQRHQLANCDPRQGGIGNMVNCGAAMYIAPIGAMNAGDPEGAYHEAIRFASGHQESYGLEAAGVLAAAVAAAFIPGIALEEVIARALSLAKDGTKAACSAILEAVPHTHEDNAAAVFQEIIGQYSVMGDDLTHTPARAGRVSEAYRPSRVMSIEELPLALGFVLLAKGDFKKAVQLGINSGRDADSIGVMAGAILGAFHGTAVIDPADAAQLDAANRLDLARSAADFAAAVQTLIVSDAQRMEQLLTTRLSLMD